jgi:glycosyltransferase involved in cell wall biosynthesis
MEKMEYIQGLISVIVPVYNVKNYLDRCIESILSQTYKKIEVLLIDDGSKDGSGEICDEWQTRDSRIQVFHKKNGGASSARNMGLEKCAGQWIGFVDSDDYISKDMYESMIKEMEEDTDIICSGTATIYPARMKTKSDLYDFSPRKVVFTNMQAMEELLLIRYLSFSPCDKLFRREIFLNIRFPEKKECEDLPALYDAVKNSRNVVNIGKIKYFYCYRENSMSRRSFQLKRLSYVLFARDILKDIIENYPNLKKEAEAMYIRNAFVVIQEIRASKNRKNYMHIEKRLKKMLLYMQVHIINNPYITREMKCGIIKLIT